MILVFRMYIWAPITEANNNQYGKMIRKFLSMFLNLTDKLTCERCAGTASQVERLVKFPPS